jgi:transcriptional regulator with XRE-family HTH domain
MFAEKLKEARIASGLSQKYIAEQLQLTRPIYNQIEQGKILPKIEDLPKIAKILNIDTQKLQNAMCIHTKTACIHYPKRKSSTSTYKLTVALNRGEFSQLTASNLKKCGYKNLQEFVKMAYEQLQNQLQIIELNNTKQGG